MNPGGRGSAASSRTVPILDEIAQPAVDMLGPHLARWDSSDRMSDPDH